MPINFVAAKCPNCKADIQVDDNMKKCFCQYCGTQIIVDDAIQMVTGTVTIDRTAEIANLEKRLDRLMMQGDYERAEDCCNKILDIDCDNFKANDYLGLIERAIIQPNLTVQRIGSRPRGESKAFLYIDDERIDVDLDIMQAVKVQIGSHKIQIGRGFFKSQPVWFDVNGRNDRMSISFEPKTFTIKVYVS